MLLIDGYNLLFAEGRVDRRKLPAARERLVARIARYCQVCGLRARVVFDYTKGPPAFAGEARARVGPVEVRYMPRGVTADDEILGTLAGTKDRTAYTVVTGDRAIADEAERRLIDVIDSGKFAAEIERILREDEGKTGEAPEKSRGLKPGEADYWMREFGLPDE